MRLFLKVVSAQAANMGAKCRKVLDHEGARIGRDGTNDWIIDDPYISGFQAAIRFVNGLYFLERKGKAKMSINDRAKALAKDDPQLLRTGDHLFIDEYEITVQIAETEELLFEDEPDGPEPSPMGGPEPEGSRRHLPEPEFENIDVGGGNILELLGDGPTNPDSHDGRPGDKSDLPGSILDVPVEPLVSSLKVKLDDDWYKTQLKLQEASVQQTPAKNKRAPIEIVGTKRVERQPRSESSSDPFAIVLEGAGLDANRVDMSEDVVRQFGQVLRIVVQGTMDALSARATVKAQFQLPDTRLKESKNNPLKFSSDARDVLENLLIKKNPAYMDTAEAFEDAFAELAAHQMATAAGLQAGMESVMAYFSPDKFQAQADKTAGRGLQIGSAKGRYWEHYVETYRTLVQDPEDAFTKLFGRAFGRKYEAELRRAKSEIAERKRGGKG